MTKKNKYNHESRANIIGLDYDYSLIWKHGDFLLSSSEKYWLDGFLSKRAKELLKNVKSKEILNACRDDETALWTVYEEEMVSETT